MFNEINTKLQKKKQWATMTRKQNMTYSTGARIRRNTNTTNNDKDTHTHTNTTKTRNKHRNDITPNAWSTNTARKTHESCSASEAKSVWID